MIRPARPGDIPAIHRLIRGLAEYERALDQVSATEEDLRRALLAEPPALFAHVAEHDGAVVGFALWFLNFSTWDGRHGIYLEDLFVEPQARGLGLGRALLTELAWICVERGYTRLVWAVLDWNAPARGFYESLGATPLDEWVSYRLAGPALRALAAGSPGSGPPG